MHRLFTSSIVLIALAACLPLNQNGGQGSSSSSAASSEAAINRADVKEAASQTLRALKEKDMATLALYVHPRDGVRFTPYTNVYPEADLTYSASDLADAFDDSKTHMWGHYDGSGHAIMLTFAEYFDRFVWNQDYTTADEVNWNKNLSRGNMRENASEIYPGSQIVEFHFTGFDPQFEGMDWTSLRLVFEDVIVSPSNHEWYLVGIIHDQWMI